MVEKPRKMMQEAWRERRDGRRGGRPDGRQKRGGWKGTEGRRGRGGLAKGGERGPRGGVRACAVWRQMRYLSSCARASTPSADREAAAAARGMA